MKFELMRELHRITEYRDNSIWKTELVWVGWFPEEEVPEFGQRDGWLYIVMSTDYPFPTIRRAKKEESE